MEHTQIDACARLRTTDHSLAAAQPGRFAAHVDRRRLTAGPLGQQPAQHLGGFSTLRVRGRDHVRCSLTYGPTNPTPHDRLARSATVAGGAA